MFFWPTRFRIQYSYHLGHYSVGWSSDWSHVKQKIANVCVWPETNCHVRHIHMHTYIPYAQILHYLSYWLRKLVAERLFVIFFLGFVLLPLLICCQLPFIIAVGLMFFSLLDFKWRIHSYFRTHFFSAIS